RMRTSKGTGFGLISVDSPVEQALPDAETFEMLRLLAMVGANAVENVMLARTVNELEIEHEMHALRQELQDEVALRRALLATGTAALTQRTVISNVGQDDRVIVEVPDSTDVDEHLMAVPVLVEEQTKAVLTMRRPADLPPFLPDDAHRAGLFAQHVASVFLL